MTTIDCKELANLLDPYLDDALSEESRGQIERHLMTCEACAFRTRSFEQSRELVRQSFPHEETTPGFRERLAARLHSEFDDILVKPNELTPSQLELPYLKIS